MKLKEFLNGVVQMDNTNFFVLCPDKVGIRSLIKRALEKVASSEDISIHHARDMTVETAHLLRERASSRPIAGSKRTHFFIHSLQNLNAPAAAVLLKVVEETRTARFIFQSQTKKDPIGGLRSRSVEVEIPFLTKREVLGNLQALQKDAAAAERLNLWDGTLENTLRLSEDKQKAERILHLIQMGIRGREDLLQEVAIDEAMEFLTRDCTQPELMFLERGGLRGNLLLFRKLSENDV